MSECTKDDVGLWRRGHPQTITRFDGGEVCSEVALMLPRRVDACIGLTSTVAAIWRDPRDTILAYHSESERDGGGTTPVWPVQGPYEDLNDHGRTVRLKTC